MSSLIPKLEFKSSSKGADADVVIVYQVPSKKSKSETKSSKSKAKSKSKSKSKPKLITPKGPYGGLANKLEKDETFMAALGSDHLVTYGGLAGAKSVLFVGMGNPAETKTEKFRLAGASTYRTMSRLRAKKVRVDLKLWENKACPVELAPALRAFAEGFALCAYKVNRYKTDEKKEKYFGPNHITFTGATKGQAELKKQLSLAVAVADCLTITRDWSNEPPNIGTPEFYAASSKSLASKYGLKCRILKQEDCKREKMGLLTGVGQGSVRDDRVVVLEYNPKGVKKPKTVCLVGKGVTFDTGGISIKPSGMMEDMKHDMTGAATVMGAIVLASKMKVKNRVIALMGFVENMPAGNAITPGSVLTSRSGKTVEIINTDAEGRLVLADVLDLAQDYKPACIVDIATLTGAVLVALGNLCTAVMGNNDEFVQKLIAAGAENDERIWQLPLWDEYSKDMRSDYADVKNSVNNRLGGTIRGAAFLKEFVRKDVQWAHLDIAATAWDVGHHNYHPRRGATGTMVRALATLTEKF